MIAALIGWCVRNRALVLLLTLFLIAGGVWSVFSINVDAIPDLSDVQVIVYTDFPGQAPQIVEDQVTYPLTRELLNMPRTKAVRGNSLFGTSFISIIFEDGTDIYWARSRVLERLNYVAGKLPAGVTPQLGPDATGVGWIYEYVLTTGNYCPKHPNGLWHDPTADIWYASPQDAPPDPAVQQRLVRHRAFTPTRFAWWDAVDNRRYERPQDAPDGIRGRLTKVEVAKGYDRCPLDGSELLPAQQSLADLRGIQDWRLRYELTSVPGVSEVAAVGGFQKQYQVTVDPVRLLARNVTLEQVRSALAASNSNVGGRVIEWSEREYAVQGLGYLGTMTDAEIAAARSEGITLEEARTAKVVADLKTVSLGSGPQGEPIRISDVADVRIGPQMRRGVIDWNGQGEAVGGIVVMRHAQNAATTIDAVRAKLAEVESSLPPGVAIEVGYDRSDLIQRAVGTLTHTLLEEITVVALVCILFLLHARSELVAVFVVPTGVLASILLMHVLGINANIMSLGGIAIAIGVMVDSSIVMVENAHKHLDRHEDENRAMIAAGLQPVERPRTQIITEAAQEVGPSLFFALMVLTVSFLPIFLLQEQQGRLFKPLAYTKTFAMAASSFLAVTAIPVLMSILITSRVLPKRWGWVRNLLITVAVMAGPAVIIMLMPLGQYTQYRPWLALGWVILAGMLLVPQKIIHENSNPISWLQQRMYNPLFSLVMRLRRLTLLVAVVAVAWVGLLLATIIDSDWFAARAPWALRIVPTFGSEFMPPLEEGDLLYMPTTDPGISMDKARQLLQQTDRMIVQFPEVQSVMGKAGRAETATDPAPVNMLETTITLHRDKSRWRQVPVKRFYSGWPDWLADAPRKYWPETRPITVGELISGYDLPGGHVAGLDQTVAVPGLTNSWTMPISTRISMLTTGIKTKVGVKIMGPDLATLSDLAARTAEVLKTDPRLGGHTASAYAEKTLGGSYLDIRVDRQAIARLGRAGTPMTVQDVNNAIATAVGGQDVTLTVEGLERYTVNVRYPGELRDSLPTLKETLVATPSGAQVPLGQLASFEIRNGPDMIKSEDARPTAWVTVDIGDIDVGTYVADARKVIDEKVPLPQGYTLVWSGQYEYLQSLKRNMAWAIPLTFVLIVMLLYLASRSWLRVCIVLLAVPFSLLGAFALLHFMGYELSTAVAVGMIALAGLDAETGTVMLLYLDTSFERFKHEGRMRNTADLWHAVHDGAVKRIRPKTMTVATAFIGLLPLLWATGAGADTMRRLAAPMIGGLVTSYIMELLIYPVVFYTAKLHLEPALRKQSPQSAQP